MLQEKILKEAPRLNKPFATEFCVVNGEFSNLQCLMKTLEILIISDKFQKL